MKKNKTKDFIYLKKQIEAILSKTAIFISFLSLFAIIYQSYLGREENELMLRQQRASVLPYLHIAPSFYDNQFEFTLFNQGVGPAIIKEVHFKSLDVNGKDTLSFVNSDRFIRHNFWQKLPFKDSLELLTSTLKPNMLLPSRDKINVFTINFKNIPSKGIFIRDTFLESLNYKIVYEDVYGARWYISSKDEAPKKIEDES